MSFSFSNQIVQQLILDSLSLSVTVKTPELMFSSFRLSISIHEVEFFQLPTYKQEVSPA